MGRYDLGLSEYEFWHLTFREFYGLVRRHRRADDDRDFRAGIVAANILNTIPAGKDAKVWTPSDFFPRLRRWERVEEEHEITEADVDAFWNRAVGIFQGFVPEGPPVVARVG